MGNNNIQTMNIESDNLRCTIENPTYQILHQFSQAVSYDSYIIPKLICFTCRVYCLIFYLQHSTRLRAVNT
jgi:hypothetical protein